MMKTNDIAKKLVVWLAISAFIVVLGLVFFFISGFTLSSNEKDNKSVAVSYDAYITMNDEYRDQVEDVCLDVFSSNGLKNTSVAYVTLADGGAIEFYFDAATDSAKLVAAKDAILNKLATADQISQSTFEAAVHEATVNNFTSYIWRGAVAAAVVLAVAFVYTWIRFRFGAALTVLVLGVNDVLLVIALTLICHVPVAASFMGALGFSLVYSLFNSVLAFAEIRRGLNNENIKVLPSQEALEVVTTSARKNTIKVSIMACAAVVVLAVASAIVSVNALLYFIPAAFAVVVTAYSSCTILPSIYIPLKEAADKKAAAKSKYSGATENSKKIAEKTEVSDID